MKRVLVQKTRLVLLDEPFLDLEASDRSEMTQLIQAIAQQGRTVIICSRSLHDANAVCSRVAVLYRGEIQAVGTVPELLANRGNLPFIVDLLPDEAVGTLLEYICQTVGVPHQTNSLSSETQTERPREKMPLQGVHQPAESGADTVLLSLSKPAPCGGSQVAEPTTVNHELLAALTKPVERKHPLHPKL